MAADFDRSWRAVLDPGSSADMFAESFHEGEPLRATATAGFCRTTAWALSELSRAIYRPCGSDPSRALIAARAGFAELQFWDLGGAQCGLFERPEAFALCFRGTAGLRHWLFNLEAVPARWAGAGSGGVFVHAGFLRAFQGTWPAVAAALAAAASSQPAKPVLYCGHSLGGALAALAAAAKPPAATYTFGAPRVGNAAFADAASASPTYRIAFHRDIVPSVPRPLPKPDRFAYTHAGDPWHLARSGALSASDKLEPPPMDWLKLGSPKAIFAGAEPPPFLWSHAPTNYSRALAARR